MHAFVPRRHVHFSPHRLLTEQSQHGAGWDFDFSFGLTVDAAVDALDAAAAIILDGAAEFAAGVVTDVVGGGVG